MPRKPRIFNFKVVFGAKFVALFLSVVNQDKIRVFLQDFHVKMKIWGIVVRDDRGKNTQTLLDLEITKDQRNKVLESLVVEDYSEGPVDDMLHKGADMWIFGKIIKGKEIYIKIAMGVPGAKAICISFHIAGFTMNYPYRPIKGADLGLDA